MGPKGRSWVGNVRIAHISLVNGRVAMSSRGERLLNLFVFPDTCHAHRTASTRLVLYSSCVLQTTTL